MQDIEIKQGQIWQVNRVMRAIKTDDKSGRYTLIRVGEKIEIRYPYAWHFRTEDNKYFQAEPEEIKRACSLYGEIIWEVKLENKANLEEILRLKLYKDLRS
jgi:hypothetical protein